MSDDIFDGDPVELEPLTPSFLFDVGYGGACHGECVARTLAAVVGDYGVLCEWQVQAVSDGHAAGSRDRIEWVKDDAGAAEVDTSEIPF